jgi:O-methyltransferase
MQRARRAADGVTDRRVWVADSFQGLPPPNAPEYPNDEGYFLSNIEELSVSLTQVRSHFERYDLLDDQVVFLEGWFRDTLPTAPIERLAVMRLDGDLYESTMDALVHLYPKLSTGGYVIIDDYGALPPCREAVVDFRRAHAITDKLLPIDWTGMYWQRT